MSEKRAKSLVLDTSVALKFYLPEEGHEEALGLLEAAEAGARYCQKLWIGLSGHAATFSSVPSTNFPFVNSAPALTRATR